MKAWTLYGIGDIRLEEVKRPSVKAGEVLVKVSAASICGSDIPRIYRDGAHRLPLILGHEFTGKVEEVGAGVDRGWAGKRVGVFPLIPCRRCLMCRQKHYELCGNYNYLGSRCNGGFAEYVAVPEWNLIQLPDSVEDVTAAMMEPMAVAVHAMRQSRNKGDRSSQKRAAVIGLGTIGMLLVMFLKEAGYETVYAVGNKALQKKTALHFGVREEEYLDAGEGDAVAWLLERTKGRGVDLIFECTGRNETYIQAIAAAGPLGQVVLVGNPTSKRILERETYWRILRNQLNICGTWNSSFTKEASDDWHYVLKKLSEGRIHPEWLLSHSFSFSCLEEGLHIMRDKKEDYLKVMLTL